MACFARFFGVGTVRVGPVTASQAIALKVGAMSKKVTASVLIVGLVIALAVSMRTTNRADAAAGDCYADSKGPAEPTVCN
jgi:hypothetical protein